jgi:hypothetical protein
VRAATYPTAYRASSERTITGGNSGTGLVTAKRFVADGA